MKNPGKGVKANAANTWGQTALHLGALSGITEVAEILLKAGLQVDIKDCWEFTPLFYAAKSGQARMIAFLLGKGSKVDHEAVNGGTALLEAATCNHATGAVGILLDHGADINYHNASAYHGNTALHQAAEMGNADVVSLLLQRGAKKDMGNFAGITPLEWARAHHQDEVCRILEGVPKPAKPPPVSTDDF